MSSSLPKNKTHFITSQFLQFDLNYLNNFSSNFIASILKQNLIVSFMENRLICIAHCLKLKFYLLKPISGFLYDSLYLHCQPNPPHHLSPSTSHAKDFHFFNVTLYLECRAFLYLIFSLLDTNGTFTTEFPNIIF